MRGSERASWRRRRRSPLRTITALAAALVAAVVLSACSGLPITGAVHQGLAVDGVDANNVLLLPDGPVPGAGPVDVVRGFLRASTGFDDTHDVARSFLAPQLARSWQPGAQVTVLSGFSPQITGTGDRVQVRGSVVATIGPDGRYSELHAAQRLSAAFSVAKVRGQWRISRAPKNLGLLLTTSDLNRLYRPYAIYYAVPTSKVLIPDIRWLPSGSGLATSLARAQLAPVPGYLDGAAVTGVTAGSRLSLDAVPVQAGLATVDLATPGLSADPGMRQALWAQFVATLTQVEDGMRVSLEVGGSTVALPDMRGYPSSPADVGYTQEPVDDDDAAVVLRVGTKLQRTARDVVTRDGVAGTAKGVAPVLPGVPTGWIGLALSDDGVQLAAVGGDRAQLALWRGTKLTVAPRFATDLTRPAFDGFGWLWTAGVPVAGHSPAGSASAGRSAATARSSVHGRATALRGSRVYALTTGAQNGLLVPSTVSAPWLAGRVVVALRVAADGQRAALVSRRPDGSDVRVQITGIVRGSDGRPRSLSGPLRVGTPLTRATDLTWVDDRTVAVLGQVSPVAALRPYLVGIGAWTAPLAPVKDARWITSTGDARSILVTTDSAKIYERAGAGWAVQGRGSDVAVGGG